MPPAFLLGSNISYILSDNVTSIYTSGRKCNFQNKGCDGPHLQPINVNGWFWAGAGNGRIPPTNVPHPESAWSRTGETGIPQPDNYEGIKEGPIEAENNIGITIEGLQEFHDEACLAVLNNKYGDGIKWHDVACHFRCCSKPPLTLLTLPLIGLWLCARTATSWSTWLPPKVRVG